MAEKMAKPLTTAELETALANKLAKAGYGPDAVSRIMEMTKPRNLDMKAGFGIDKQDAQLVWNLRHSSGPVTKENVASYLLKGPTSTAVAVAIPKKAEAVGFVYSVEANGKSFMITCEKPLTGTDDARRRILLYGEDNKVLKVQNGTIAEFMDAIHSDAGATIMRSKKPSV